MHVYIGLGFLSEREPTFGEFPTILPGLLSGNGRDYDYVTMSVLV